MFCALLGQDYRTIGPLVGFVIQRYNVTYFSIKTHNVVEN